MKFRRYITNVWEDARTLEFDLVVRTEDNQQTYGGGRVTLQLPMTDADIEAQLDIAVLRIVKYGDKAYPKTPATKVGQPGPHARYMQARAESLNKHDWPTLGVVKVRNRG